MVYLYLAAAIISSGLAGNVYKRLCGKSGSAAMSTLFPALWFLPLSLVFCISMIVGGTSFTALLEPALLWPALGGGLGMALAASILIESMKHNSLSISVILVNLNFIIPVVLSMLFLQEKTGWIQLAGMLLSVAVILLLNLKKEEGASGEKFAILLPCITCLANGMVNFCIKIHQNQMGGNYLNGYYTLMYLSGGIICLLLWVVFRRNTDKKLPEGKSAWLGVCTDALMLGGCNGVCFYMTGLLAGQMNAAAQFTIITAASILLSLAIGVLFQKDPLTKKSVLSFVFCLAAIICQAFGY